MNLIDFVTIVPYFIELAFQGTGSNLTALISLRVLRLLRVLRILKLTKHNKQIPIATVPHAYFALPNSFLTLNFQKAFRRSGAGFLMALFTMLVVFILFASAEYYAELSDAKFDPEQQLWL